MENPVDTAYGLALLELEEMAGDLVRLPEPLLTVLAVCTVQGVVDNGGFRYFFESDFPGNPPYSLFSASYRRIDADEVADCIDRMVALFPFAEPHRHESERRRFLDSLDDQVEWMAQVDRLFGEQSLWEGLERYVAKHQAVFDAVSV